MLISISRLKTFKACRRAYYFKYIEGLEPVQKADALETGLGYHSLVEALNNNEGLPEDEFTKECAMARAYEKYIYPKVDVAKAEEWVRYDLGQGDTLIGRVDGIAEDGSIVEHKTTSAEITEEYEFNLQWDEQILAYMLCTGERKIYYTVCRKPTIRQKNNESAEEFYRRCVEWFDEDTESKIRLLKIERTDDEVEEFRKDLIATMEELKNSKTMYRNCLHCFRWGRQCEYAPICLHYNPDEVYTGFIKNDTKGEQNGVTENR